MTDLGPILVSNRTLGVHLENKQNKATTTTKCYPWCIIYFPTLPSIKQAILQSTIASAPLQEISTSQKKTSQTPVTRRPTNQPGISMGSGGPGPSTMSNRNQQQQQHAPGASSPQQHQGVSNPQQHQGGSNAQQQQGGSNPQQQQGGSKDPVPRTPDRQVTHTTHNKQVR